MTMPHLSNCPHSGEGWCIQCVKELRENLEHADHRIGLLLTERTQFKKALEEKNKTLEIIRVLVSEE